MNKLISINELLVSFNDVEVGKLKLQNNNIYFQYHKDWIKNGFSISPFKIPLKEKIFIFDQIDIPIWGIFLDCLPDGWGIRLNIIKCAKYNINYEKLNILEKLSLTDSTGLGGLTFKPKNKIYKRIKIDLDNITNDVMENYYNILNLKLIDEIYHKANSSGGARPKIHFKDKGGSNWIIKFPTSKENIDSGIDEYNANMLAKKCYININECKLIRLKSGVQLFASKRFDIDENIKKHIISISGLLDLDFRRSVVDYSTIFEIVDLISVNKEKDFYDFFSRMVFNYKFGNCDDHMKNTSFIYDENLKGYKLSPAYDITKTLDLKYHSLLCNEKEFPNNDDFLFIAKKFNLNINKCKYIIDLIEKNIKEYE